MTPQAEAIAAALHDGGWVPAKAGCLLSVGESPLEPGGVVVERVVGWRDCEHADLHRREANDIQQRLWTAGWCVVHLVDAEALR